MPQFKKLVCVSTQDWPHWVNAPQSELQAEAKQNRFEAQILPHPPQLAGSEVVSAHTSEHASVPAGP
jgi:hypothetical protein